MRECQRSLGAAGFELNCQTDSPPARVEEAEPDQPKFGWQQKATRKLEKKFIDEVVWPRLDNTGRALLRSQHGPLVSAPFTALPTSRVTRIRSAFPSSPVQAYAFALHLSMRTCR